MNNWPPFVPYLILAFVCAVACGAIALGACVFSPGRTVTDTGMLAIAGMTFAPAVLGIGIAANMPHDRR
jgi:hypothetical protein